MRKFSAFTHAAKSTLLFFLHCQPKNLQSTCKKRLILCRIARRHLLILANRYIIILFEKRGEKMAVTIIDIAREAQCSTATVSLALKNSEKIRLETRERVQEIADRLGYHPNYAARSLIRGQTGSIGVVIPNLENPLFIELLQGVEEYITEQGFCIVLGVSALSAEREKRYLSMLSERQVDGLILFPTFLNETFPEAIEREDDHKVPLVLCGSSGLISSNVNYVMTDNRMGAYIGTEHLIQLGCKHIAFIGAIVDMAQAQTRLNGYRDALEFYGLDNDPALEVYCSPEADTVFQKTVELLRSKTVDAIFCLYDYMAFSVIRAVESLGLRIPEDVAIVGYDNVSISARLSKALTSIDTHSYKVGRTAAEILLKKIEKPETPNRQIVFKPELVVRETTAGKK